VVIAGLLGGLAVYDALNKPQPPAMPKMAAAPAEPVEEPKAVEEKLAESKPVDGAGESGKDVAAAEKPEDAKLTKTDAPIVPERTDTPLAAPQSEKSLKAERLAKPVTPPASAHPAAIKPSAPIVAPVKPDAAREIARVVPESTAPAVAAERKAMAAHAPAPRPLTQTTVDTVHRFLLQVGVFSNHANAEELVARLQQAGVPAQIESRVQVGPFASRQEAESARAKLKSLGIDDGMLVRR